MSNYLYRIVLFLGALAILGIVAVQSFYLIRSWDLKDKEFDISVQIALKRAALEVAKYNETALPKDNLINRRSSNIYAVNTNSPINPVVLENILYQELGNLALLTEFEYAVYSCESDELVYGNYCEIGKSKRPKTSTKLPRFDLSNYYFVVIFPHRQSYLVSNFKSNLIIAGLAVLSVLVFTSFIFIVLRQKKLSSLQQDFINNMTHEFKTPISSVKLAVTGLKNQLKDHNNQRVTNYINIIENQNKRLNDQIENVLQIAKMESPSGVIIRKESIDIKEITKSAVDEFALSYPEGQFIFETDDDHVQLLTDPVHYNNILFTLIDNAVKYSPDKIKVNVKLERTSGYLCLRITDHGIGIPKEKQKKVFEKFYRVPTGNIHNVKGFGLGLHYVKNICDILNWKIKLYSEPGRGSVFTIIIPEKNLKQKTNNK